MNKRQKTAAFFDRMTNLGFSHAETDALLKAERALSRFAELECGISDANRSVSVFRDEETGRPFYRVESTASAMNGRSARNPSGTRRRPHCKPLRGYWKANPAFQLTIRQTRAGFLCTSCALATSKLGRMSAVFTIAGLQWRCEFFARCPRLTPRA